MDLNYQQFWDTFLSLECNAYNFYERYSVWFFVDLEFEGFQCSLDTQDHSREKKRKKGKPGPATSRHVLRVNSRAAFSTTSCISRRKRRDCPFLWLQLAQSINTRCFFLYLSFLYIFLSSFRTSLLSRSLVTNRCRFTSVIVMRERKRKRERGRIYAFKYVTLRNF